MISIPLAAEINACEFLIARNFGEDESGAIRLTIQDGAASSESVTLQLGETQIHDCYPVTPTGRIFEIVWKNYIAYCMQNESYTGPKKENEVAVGGKFSVYSKSHFLEYVANGTFATFEYPGPFAHYSVATETHVLHVVSVDAPQIRSIRASDLADSPNLPSVKTYSKK